MFVEGLGPMLKRLFPAKPTAGGDDGGDGNFNDGWYISCIERRSSATEVVGPNRVTRGISDTSRMPFDYSTPGEVANTSQDLSGQ